MPGMTLPPGFRFHPTDEELVDYYLKKRVKNIPIEFDVIADVDLYKCEPWDLPSKSKLPQGDNEWFFFSPRDRKYPNGSRTNRATEAGYWKATGRDRTVRQGTKTIGMKKTLVFYRGRAPHGGRTDWLMHEYRLDGEEWENMNVLQDAYVLCRVFKKNGLPKNPSGRPGSMEEGDQVDSPGEVKSSTFGDIDVKPSMSSLANLPRPLQPVSRSEVVSGSEGHGANGPEILAIRAPTVFSEDPFVHSGSFRIQFNPDSDGEGFFVDEALDKVRNDEESLEEFYSICPPLEGSSLQLGDEEKLIHNVGSTKYVRTEFTKQWQEQVVGAYQAFGGHTSTKPEEFVLPPMLEENDFDFDGPLPTLVQLPSPPTASPSFDENDTESSCVSSSNNNFATIRIRPRPSSVSSPLVGNGSSFTAPRRILRQIPLQMARTVTTSPSVTGELAPKLSVEQKFVSQKEKAEIELDQSLDSQAPTSEMSQLDSEVASSQDNSWAANVISAPVPEVSSDEAAVEDNNSPVTPAGFVPLSRKSVVNPLIPSKPDSEGISSVHTGAGNLTALPSGSAFPFQKSAVGEVLEKQVCSQDSDSGVTSVTQGSIQGVDQLNHCHTLKTAEAVEKDEKDAETCSPTKKSLVNESNSLRIMGLRLLEPICASRKCSMSGISSSKQNMTSRELPPGIGSIHVNAVTVTCSCSSAGLPHVPTKACACYTTFWEGRCENENFTKGESSVVQGLEQRNNPGPTPSSSVGFVIVGFLLAVLFVQLLSVFPAHFAYFSREQSSLSSRDLLFILVGAVLFFLVQRSSVARQLLRRRRCVNSTSSSLD